MSVNVALDTLEKLDKEVCDTLNRLQQAHEERDKLRAEKEGAYRERNQCVAALAWLAMRLAYRVWLGRHPDDPSWDPEWRTIVFIELPTGQVSWHIHDSERHLFDGVTNSDGKPWDGHTTPEKYERCARLATESA